LDLEGIGGTKGVKSQNTRHAGPMRLSVALTDVVERLKRRRLVERHGTISSMSPSIYFLRRPTNNKITYII
jgi:hypothetical protein